MGYIQWDNSLFSINVDEIDAQHKTWVQTHNELQNALNLNDTENIIKETTKAVQNMYEYTQYHFSTEEAYMKSINYPDLPAHKLLHDAFAKEILEIYTDVLEGRYVLSYEVMKKLTTWLQEHILQVDKQIGIFASNSSTTGA